MECAHLEECVHVYSNFDCSSLRTLGPLLLDPSLSYETLRSGKGRSPHFATLWQLYTARQCFLARAARNQTLQIFEFNFWMKTDQVEGGVILFGDKPLRVPQTKNPSGASKA